MHGHFAELELGKIIDPSEVTKSKRQNSQANDPGHERVPTYRWIDRGATTLSHHDIDDAVDCDDEHVLIDLVPLDPNAVKRPIDPEARNWNSMVEAITELLPRVASESIL